MEDIKGIKGKALSGKKIVLGICGSIAAVETVKLARGLARYGAEVYPVMSSSALDIISPHALEFATGRRPICELTGKIEHVALCGEREERADLLLIAPATSNTIGKIACGIDDTPVTTMATTALGSGIPVLIAPAMHQSMYKHPKVSENVDYLRGIGVKFLGPDIQEKKAKMLTTESIVYRVMNALRANGRSALVIAGPTTEFVDDMRAVTNRSTGRTGIELAKALFRYGFETELWLNAGIEPPAYLKKESFTDVQSLIDLVGSGDLDYDIIVNSAAISDYTPKRSEGKIPSGKEKLVLEMKPTPKVLDLISKKIGRNKGTVLVAFKACSGISHEALLDKAVALMERSGADMVVANLLDRVGERETEVTVLTRKEKIGVAGTKFRVAEDIVSNIILPALDGDE